ncbi:MAG: hypothetical protein ACXAC2_16650 [Candidatus Kariarchaeaceae archaeon]|jgi:hypothetical protein
MVMKINIQVIVDVEEEELQDVIEDLESGIENHVSVGPYQNEVTVVSVQELNKE